MISKAIIKISILTTLLSLGTPGFSQTEKEIIQLKNTVNATSSDTERTNALISICFFYLSSNPDSGLYYGDLALQASRAAGYSIGEVKSLNGIAAVYSQMGNSDKSLQNLLAAIKICEEKNLTAELQNTLGNMGSLYAELADYRQAIYYYLRSIDIAERNNIGKSTVGTYHIYLGQIYTLVGLQDSALLHVRKGYEILQKIKLEDEYANAFSAFGDIYSNRSDNGTALHYYYLALEESRKFQRDEIVCETLLKLAKVFNKMGRGDSALLCAKESLWSARNIRYTRIVKETGEFLTNYYKANNNTDSAFKYIEVLMVAKDSLFSEEKVKNIKDLQFSEHIRDQELAAQSQAFRNRTKFIILGSILFLFVIVLVVLWRNNRLKQKAFNSLSKQKEQTDIQKEKADTALMELKGAQAQLIQSEKMASLGELTAGIAHEIQNPLNFVNNFSEVNNELIEELKIKNEKLNINDGEVNDLLNDIYQNNEKISNHGKRADAIVKGMLQHSRSSSGRKEPTDINALVDEYSRLAYHGLRAKDKDFNAILKSDYDPGIGKINIIPQDIGRVVLNLITNAFYAVGERRASTSSAAGASTSSAANPYEPTVTVSTALIPPLGARGPQVQIKVADNGGGIPQKVLEKIFQPFFTTKPTGQGTGLGLSLSYDIVKAHGGEFKVETKESEGTKFIIQLPIT